MKVLHFNTYITGGAAKAALRLHAELLEQGVDSEMLILYPTGKLPKGVFDFREGLSVVTNVKKKVANKVLQQQHAARLKGLPQAVELFSFPESVWDLTRHPSFETADVIHLHWVAGFLDWRTFFQKCQKPLVWTLHDFEPFSGGFHYDFGVDEKPFKQLIYGSLAVKTKALQNADIEIITPSSFLGEASKKSDLLGRFKHQTVRNGILKGDHPYIEQQQARAHLGLPQNKKVLLFLSDYLFYKRKGLHEFLEAAKRLEDQNVFLCLVGGLRGEAPPLGDHIAYFPSTTNDQELNHYFAAADVYVNASLADISSNTLMEAQAMGCPVAVFRTGGIPELAALSESVFVATEKTPASLESAIQNALQIEISRTEISKTAHRVYGIQNMIPAYQKLYNSLL